MNKECTVCKISKPTDEYHKSSRLQSGFQSRCKLCAKQSSKASASKKQEHYRKVRAIRRSVVQKQIREWKETKQCTYCPESATCCLDLHHLDPTVKEDHPSQVRGSFKSFLVEAEKCIVVCRNCHAKIHAQQLLK